MSKYNPHIEYDENFVDLPSWVNPNSYLSCIPIIQGYKANKNKITSTAFLFSYNRFIYLITAYHCLFDTSLDMELECAFGFKKKTPISNKYYLIFNKDIMLNLNNWIIDKEKDIAVLPIKIDFISDTIHEIITEKNLPKNFHINKETSGITFGFPMGNSSITTEYDEDYLDSFNYSDKEKEKISKEGYPLWIPHGSLSNLIGVGKTTDVFMINSVAVNGFSGGPLLFDDGEINKLIGVVILADPEEYIDENGHKKLKSRDLGYARNFNSVINLINRIEPKFIIDLDSVKKDVLVEYDYAEKRIFSIYNDNSS
jgi:hypothetical protein